MFRTSESVRNEFVDPPPQDQSSATLVLGDERIPCRLTEVSIGGFTVVVPRATMWTGEPLSRLLTQDAAYRVRIMKQNAVYDGFEMKLQRLDERVQNRPATRRWAVHVFRCSAIGLILALVYSLIVIPSSVSRVSAGHVTLMDVVNYWRDMWTSPTAEPVQRIAKQTVAANASDETDAEDLLDEEEMMPAIVVSWGSQSGSASDLPQETGHGLDRVSLLKAAIKAANTERSRPANASTLPWLFSKDESQLVNGLRCRITTRAGEDLKVFEAGLRSLTAAAASDAARSMREALLGIATTPEHITVLAGLPEVGVIRSDDAEVFFRTVDGEIELLRILPIELEDDASPRPRTALAAPGRKHR